MINDWSQMIIKYNVLIMYLWIYNEWIDGIDYLDDIDYWLNLSYVDHDVFLMNIDDWFWC